MTRIAIFVMTGILLLSGFGTAWAEEGECKEVDFSMATLPVHTVVKYEKCVRITIPPNAMMTLGKTTSSLLWDVDSARDALKTKNVIASVRNAVVKSGNTREVYELIEYQGDPGAFSGRHQEIFITEVDEWNRRESPAMWEDLSDPQMTKNGKKVVVWKDYASHISIPRGYDVRLRSDATTAVQYAGKKVLIQADEEAYLEGTAESDLVELVGVSKLANVLVATVENPIRKKKREEAEIARMEQIDCRAYKLRAAKKRPKGQPDVYDFSNYPIAAPVRIEIPFSTKRNVNVRLPRNATFQISSPKEEVEIVFGNGARIIEGPTVKQWKVEPSDSFTMSGVDRGGSIRLVLRPSQRQKGW